jgi:glycine dehydrogenase subunit 1
MKYIPQGPRDREALLKVVGLSSEDELFKFIPPHLKVKGALPYPKAQSEIEIRKTFQDFCALSPQPKMSFAGAGIYHHDVPSIVPFLQGRSEFATSYTPYQPEISQGTLQAIFEFQTLVCQLTECELSNASLYDGATSLAEAALMALRVKKKAEGKILISQGLHPFYVGVLRTYLQNFSDRIEIVPLKGDQTDLDLLAAGIKSGADLVITQSPNIFGVIENYEAVGSLIQGSETLWATATPEPLAWGVLRGPGAFGAHFVTAEGASFGAAPYLAGASYGLFATKSEYIRNLPGRLVGETVDEVGRRSYTLTFATREQFIRRDKATSNICTNQNLNMLAGLIHMTTLGKQGFSLLAQRNLSLAEYAKSTISSASGSFKISKSATFNEFCVELPCDAGKFVRQAAAEGFVCGVDMGRFDKAWSNRLLVCTTELNTKQQIDELAAFLRRSA